ncbi:MAG: DUF6364 family protein [Gemmataceae bacterium]
MDAEKKITLADRTAVWIDKRLVKQAKEIAAREECTISEIVEKLLRSPLSKRHARAFAETGNPVA